MGVYQKTIGPLIAVPIRRLDPLFVFLIAALALLLIPGLDLPLRIGMKASWPAWPMSAATCCCSGSVAKPAFSKIWLPTYWDAPLSQQAPGLHLPASFSLLPWGVCQRSAAGLGRAAGASVMR